MKLISVQSENHSYQSINQSINLWTRSRPTLSQAGLAIRESAKTWWKVNITGAKTLPSLKSAI